MRDNAAEYKCFLAVHPGGGVRRNPKRKNISAYSTPESFTPTQEDVDIAFEIRLKEMGKTTTYGDNQELVAFTRVYQYNVMVYQQHDSDKEIMDPDFMVTSDGEQNLRPNAHIAYDVCTITLLLYSLVSRLTDQQKKGEHYMSVRNLAGPHEGLPKIDANPASMKQARGQKTKLVDASSVQQSQIDVVQKSLSFTVDKVTIKNTLEQCGGNMDDAISRLIDAEDRRSPSTRESSSIERDPDSDDNVIYGPSKRRYRRLKSRAEIRSLMATKLASRDGSQESLSSTAPQNLPDSQHSSSPAQLLSHDEANGDSDWVPYQTEDEDKSMTATHPKPARHRRKLKPVSVKSRVRQHGPRPRKSISRGTMTREKSQEAGRSERIVPMTIYI